MSAPTWMKSEQSCIDNGDNVYDLNNLRKLFEVRDICEYGWLIINDSDQYEKGVKYSGWMKFAVLSFHSSECDDTNIKGALIFHGEGPSGSLRELRHSFWGEDGDGYLFYPNKRVIVAALNALEEFYDL